MLLCLRPSNLDVTTLPAVIEEWIGATHGATPEARRGRPELLFFILTMFDQHLSEKVTDVGVDPITRFQARLEASLIKPFAKVVSGYVIPITRRKASSNMTVIAKSRCCRKRSSASHSCARPTPARRK
jgi:hypothetical protein